VVQAVLQWVQMAGGGPWHADTEFGRYTVWQGSGTCWMHYPGAHRGTPGSPDVEAAKDIAEAHFAEALRVQAHENLRSQNVTPATGQAMSEAAVWLSPFIATAAQGD
jgi:hypothetical protein